jgi:hypothetical protein
MTPSVVVGPASLLANGLKPIRVRLTTRSPTDARRATADSGTMTGGSSGAKPSAAQSEALATTFSAHAVHQRRPSSLSIRRERFGGAAGPPRWTLLGAQRSRRLVHSERRSHRRRGPAGRGTARVSRGDGFHRGGARDSFGPCSAIWRQGRTRLGGQWRHRSEAAA